MRTRKYSLIRMILVSVLLTGCSISFQPKAGATFTGMLEVGMKAQASAGALSFKVSQDGASIVDLRISLENVNCKAMIQMGSVADFFSDPGISIKNGTFEGSLPAMGGMVTDYRFTPGDALPTPVSNPDTVGTINGRFTNPTTASGTITIYVAAMMTGGIVCELGTFNWTATAQ